MEAIAFDEQSMERTIDAVRFFEGRPRLERGHRGQWPVIALRWLDFLHVTSATPLFGMRYHAVIQQGEVQSDATILWSDLVNAWLDAANSEALTTRIYGPCELRGESVLLVQTATNSPTAGSNKDINLPASPGVDEYQVGDEVGVSDASNSEVAIITAATPGSPNKITVATLAHSYTLPKVTLPPKPVYTINCC